MLKHFKLAVIPNAEGHNNPLLLTVSHLAAPDFEMGFVFSLDLIPCKFIYMFYAKVQIYFNLLGIIKVRCR